MNGFLHAQMKADRAKEHLDSLNRELEIFLSKEAYAVSEKEDSEKGRYIRRTEFAPIPWRIGMLLGEFVYSLRSGLDQLAWQLVYIGGRRPAREVKFPIFHSADKQLRQCLSHFKIQAVRDAIDSLQPYHRGAAYAEHPLWQLNRLSNIDKHMVIPINSRKMQIVVPGCPGSLVEEFYDGFEVSVPLAYKEDLQLAPHGPLDIELGEWESDFRLARPRLLDIYNFVRDDVIPRFSGFFTGTPVKPVGRLDYLGQVVYW